MATARHDVRIPAHPALPAIVRGLVRAAGACVTAAGLRWPGAAAGAAALVLEVLTRGTADPLRSAIGRMPLLGRAARNDVAFVRGTAEDEAPLVVAAMRGLVTRVHPALDLLAIASAAAVCSAALTGAGVAVLVFALEPVASSIVRLVSTSSASDRTGPLAVLAERMAERAPLRSIWLLEASDLATFLHRTERAADAWVVELRSGDGIVAGRDTPPPVLRALAGAAIDTGEALDVRKGRTAPAMVALAAPDDRAVNIVDRLARTRS